MLAAAADALRSQLAEAERAIARAAELECELRARVQAAELDLVSAREELEDERRRAAQAETWDVGTQARRPGAGSAWH